MTTPRWLPAWAFGLLVLAALPCQGVELKVSRDALQRTLRQQLFGGPDGRYYLKGNPNSGCPVYADDATLTFAQDRIVVDIRTHAKFGKSMGHSCIGVALSPTAQVSVLPYGEGETIGFRDAQMIKVSDRREFNFLLTPFLSHQVPKSMQVNAADLLRKALSGSTASSGYKVSLDRLKIHSVQIQGDSLVVDVDGGLTVK
jgi:hypothetical protein